MDGLLHGQVTPDNDRFEVQRHGNKVDVNLSKHTCACNFWQLTGLPCQHAIAAIAYKHERPESYVHQWLTMDALNATYEHFIQPVNSQQYWTPTNHPKPVPPKIKRLIGRPKKHRRKDANEEVPILGHKLKRTYEAKCTTCGETGHYYKTCKGASLLKKPTKLKKKAIRTKTQEQDEVALTQSYPKAENESQVQVTEQQLSLSILGAQPVLDVVTPQGSHYSPWTLPPSVRPPPIRPPSLIPPCARRQPSYKSKTPYTASMRPPSTDFMFIPTSDLRPPAAEMKKQ